MIQYTSVDRLLRHAFLLGINCSKFQLLPEHYYRPFAVISNRLSTDDRSQDRRHLNLEISHNASLSSTSTFTTASKKNTDDNTCLLYRGRWMLPFYVLVRLKIVQLVGIAASALPLNAYFSHGAVDTGVLVSSVLVMAGSGIASASLWYYSKRYVGAMALKGVNLDTVRFIVMDFWGNRKVDDYTLDSIIPPLRDLNQEEQRQMLVKRVLVSIDVIGGRQYFVSIKHGHIINKEMLLRLLDGRHLRDFAMKEETGQLKK